MYQASWLLLQSNSNRLYGLRVMNLGMQFVVQRVGLSQLAIQERHLVPPFFTDQHLVGLYIRRRRPLHNFPRKLHPFLALQPLINQPVSHKLLVE